MGGNKHIKTYSLGWLLFIKVQSWPEVNVVAMETDDTRIACPELTRTTKSRQLLPKHTIKDVQPNAYSRHAILYHGCLLFTYCSTYPFRFHRYQIATTMKTMTSRTQIGIATDMARRDSWWYVLAPY